VAARRESKSLPLDDVVQEAQALLIAAIDSFDGAHGVPLAAWLAQKLTQGLSNYCAAQRQPGGVPVRLPRTVWRELQTLRAMLDSEAAGSPSSWAQRAAQLGISEARVHELRQLLIQTRVELEDSDVEPAGPADLLGHVLSRERIALLAREMGKLPGPQREAALLAARGAPTTSRSAGVIRQRALARLSSSYGLREAYDLSV
jgi:DNA-directed RNA polymerase specialized sigma24 family protein